MRRQASCFLLCAAIVGHEVWANEHADGEISADFFEFLVLCTDEKGQWSGPRLDKVDELDKSPAENDISKNDASSIQKDDKIKGVER
ncbi:MAG: hypothetical protein K6L73_01780 [Cellvibrionaceae bacterium]